MNTRQKKALIYAALDFVEMMRSALGKLSDKLERMRCKVEDRECFDMWQEQLNSAKK